MPQRKEEHMSATPWPTPVPEDWKYIEQSASKVLVAIHWARYWLKRSENKALGENFSDVQQNSVRPMLACLHVTAWTPFLYQTHDSQLYEAPLLG